ncbi:MAG: site-specific integrase [Pirellulales bacterium]|nr:site-specific integrase [Pirellulales bacterium]
MFGIVGENTARRHCGRAKQFFRAAQRKRLIGENPFADMAGCGVRANKDREYFLSLEDAYKVLAACPDPEWQLLFALARFGGLRIPSEAVELRWQDIDWENRKVLVRSPKTEHHDGKGSRTIPLFPELVPYLEAVRRQAQEGEEFVLPNRRNQNANLRTRLTKIIRRAGLKPWPKLWQNLRSTRQTELADQRYPGHVVCAFMGNSQAVAQKHYLQVTDDHFHRAASEPTAPVDDQGGAKAVQIPVHQGAPSRVKDDQTISTAHKNTAVLTTFEPSWSPENGQTVPPRGVEPLFSG